jgi:hypothetical protein
MSALQALAVAIGLTMANFAVPLFSELPNFGTALERSFFQATAVLTCYICIRVSNETN